MDEQTEMELGQEAQYQHETQLEQWLAELQKDIKQLQAEVEKNRWIPVSERLPKDNWDVLVLDSAKIVHLGNYEENRWHVNDMKWEGVTHWKRIVLP